MWLRRSDRRKIKEVVVSGRRGRVIGKCADGCKALTNGEGKRVYWELDRVVTGKKFGVIGNWNRVYRDECSLFHHPASCTPPRDNAPAATPGWRRRCALCASRKLLHDRALG